MTDVAPASPDVTAGPAVAKSWDVAAEFVEPGNTATDDRRPAFRAMSDAARVKPPTFTVIIVHSFSRFFRDQFQFNFHAPANSPELACG